MENMNRPNKTYVDQLLEAGPSTYFGYLVGLIIAGIPFVELLVSLPFLSHLLCFTNLLDFSQKSAFQICIYVAHAGKVFGWKMTAFVMGLGFVLSPMLTTFAVLLGGPLNFYYFVVGVTCLQAVCTALSGWNF
ncbi:unnamed protein product [Caenorhabditis brenneri]